MQTFNAKLAYANKLFINGGLTNDEKIKIAEEFDKIETIEEEPNIPNLIHTFRKLHELLDFHEKKEEKLFSILKKDQIIKTVHTIGYMFFAESEE